MVAWVLVKSARKAGAAHSDRIPHGFIVIQNFDTRQQRLEVVTSALMHVAIGLPSCRKSDSD